MVLDPSGFAMPRKKAKRKLNPRRIKAKSSYYIHELAKTLEVCQNTIHNMIKAGLPIIEGSYPYLIMGGEAIAFIKKRQEKSKSISKLDEIHCMGSSCRKKTKIKNREVTLEITAPKTGNLKGVCEVCETKTSRFISLAELPEFQKVLKIQQLPNPRLIPILIFTYTINSSKI